MLQSQIHDTNDLIETKLNKEDLLLLHEKVDKNAEEASRALKKEKGRNNEQLDEVYVKINEIIEANDTNSTRLQGQIDDLSAEFRMAEKRQESKAKMAGEGWQETARDLSEKINDLQSELDRLGVKMERGDPRVEEIEEKVNQTQNRQKLDSKELNEDIDTIQTRLQKLEKESQGDPMSEIRRIQTRLDEIDQDMNQLDTNINQVETEHGRQLELVQERSVMNEKRIRDYENDI